MSSGFFIADLGPALPVARAVLGFYDGPTYVTPPD